MVRLVVQGLPALGEAWTTGRPGTGGRESREEAVAAIPVGRNHITPEHGCLLGDGEKRLLGDLLRRKHIETDACMDEGRGRQET